MINAKKLKLKPNLHIVITSQPPKTNHGYRKFIKYKSLKRNAAKRYKLPGFSQLFEQNLKFFRNLNQNLKFFLQKL